MYGEWVDAIEAQEQKRKTNQRDNDRPLPGGSTSHVDDKDDSESDAEYMQRNDEEEMTEDDLVDYRDMPGRKGVKASEKSSKHSKPAKTKRKTISSSDSEDEEESEGLFGSESSSESEANFTDSEADDGGFQSDEPAETD